MVLMLQSVFSDELLVSESIRFSEAKQRSGKHKAVCADRCNAFPDRSTEDMLLL